MNMKNKRRLRVFVALIVFYFTTLFTRSTKTNFKELFDSMVGNERQVFIVLWTKMFTKDNLVYDVTNTFYFDANGYAEGMFDSCPPPANRCRVTNNRSLIEQSEAVLFHTQDLEGIKWPEFRSPEQRWIFFNNESPLHTYKGDQLKNLSPHLHFNWTFTYRRDSDVFLPYGPNTPGEFKRRLALEREKPLLSLPATIQNKTKLVAWVVSNCVTTSGRDRYVDELKKYITVDVYGRCSSMQCDKRPLGNNFDNFNQSTVCYEMIERDYKFYLSFENSICPDYVTEKFYNPLLFTTVPIVYGGGDYEALGVPPNSYIDVRNFKSARDLAEYLKYLDKNETAYRSYFDWRLKPPGLASLRRVQPWCNLCQKLMTENKINDGKNNAQHTFPILANTRRSYDDIYSWWFVKDPCQSQPINAL